MLEERKNAFAYLPSSSSPPAAVLSADLCSSEVERCADAAFFFFFFLPLPPSSCLFLATPPRNLKRDLTTLAQHLGDAGNMSSSARSRSHSTHVGNHRPPLGLPKTCGHSRPRRAIALRIFLISSGGGKKCAYLQIFVKKKKENLTDHDTEF